MTMRQLLQVLAVPLLWEHSGSLPEDLIVNSSLPLGFLPCTLAIPDLSHDTCCVIT